MKSVAVPLSIALVAVAGIAVWILGPRFGAPAPAPAPPAPVVGTTNTNTLSEVDQEKALHQEILSSLDRLVQTFPDSDDAVYLAGLIHNDLGNTAKALEFWRRALEMDPLRADAWSSLGEALLNDDQYPEAENHFRKAIEIEPDSTTTQSQLAKTLSLQGKMTEVIALLDPQPALPAEAIHLLGEAFLQTREYERAREAFERALELDPNLIDSHYSLSRTFARLKNREKQISHLETFKQLNAERDSRNREHLEEYSPLTTARKVVAKAHTNLGRVYMANGNRQEAEANWQRARTLDPENKMSRLQLAFVAEQEGQTKQALDYYNEALAVAPDDARLLVQIGNVDIKLNRLKQAGETFVKAIRAEPENPVGYAALIEFFLRTNRDLPRAEKLAEHCVKLAPSASHYALLGRARHANNNPAGALEAIDKAINLAPGNREYLQLREQF